MLLSKEFKLHITEEQGNIISHLGYAAYKLWNLCNYERIHADELEEYPDWYYQKKAHKDDVWFKSLPSQTAQEVCKLLDKSWKSYFALCKKRKEMNPRYPRFKQEPIPFTYMQNGIVHKGKQLRLSLSKRFKEHMAERYDIHADYLYLQNDGFEDMEHIKQIKLYPTESTELKAIVVYEVADVPIKEDNGRYLSIDLGVHNLFTCFDSQAGSFIVGRRYLSIVRFFDKEIAYYQSIADAQQSAQGIKYPKKTKRVLALYEKKRASIKDYLHKCTRYIVDYCVKNDIHRVIIGDITGIRKDANFGNVGNQKLHGLPYRQIVQMLAYKLAKEGILLMQQNEAYTSQCPPDSVNIDKYHAEKSNRKERGLYAKNGMIWNADSVGAFNILRKYLKRASINISCDLNLIKETRVIKVAV